MGKETKAPMISNLVDKEGFTLEKTKSANKRDRKRLQGETTNYGDAVKRDTSERTVKAVTNGDGEKRSPSGFEKLKVFQKNSYSLCVQRKMNISPQSKFRMR